ncbi:plasmid pRiA4b ORF-3 family protein [Murinocardiopsis flavida]|uniref:plasmid pRiA4b ORF-3 family protein n=1 Tax=Murinocardiopsis flavida TaxID=645275 RepID=UPI001475A720|nr:plasmid pRiA4b ORF-3 family protein [Murinocardiopsis flavida]
MAGSEGGGGPGSADGLIAALRGSVDPSGRPAPASQRRPRRGDVATYRVRVELTGTNPPLWRRLELDSDLFLNEVHGILQTVFGWQDYHLHRFASGPLYYSDDTEYYLAPFEAAEGETGIPEEQVRLDEVLAEAGDRLFYLYDFGDDWEHLITLQAVLPRTENVPKARCTDGKRPAPAEDCGGIGGYELQVAATDPGHPDHTAALAEYRASFGEESDPGEFAPAPFEIDATNAALTALSTPPPTNLPGPVADLVAATRDPAAARRLYELIDQAGLGEPADIDPTDAAAMVHPYAWLLDHVGTEGIKLTGAGYLPPASVEAAAAELDLGKEWIGKLNREIQTYPVFHLRTSAQALGLLRKHRGRLLPTPAGRRAKSDPSTLWNHLAQRLPLKTGHVHERQAGLLLLLAVAAERGGGFQVAADILNGIGWRLDGHTPLVHTDASGAARDTTDVLSRIGAATTDGWPPQLRTLPHGSAFARAALRSWPD